MNRNELARAVSRRTNHSAADVIEVVEAFLEVTTLTLTRCETVALRGFGKFETRQRPGTILKNHRTGDTYETGPTQTVVFLPSATLKKRLNATPF